MNKEKIKELEKQKKEIEQEIKKLKEEKPKSDREILESIEKLLEKLISNKTYKDSFDEWEKAFEDYKRKIAEERQRTPSIQPVNPYIPSDVYPYLPREDYRKTKYTWDWTYRPNTSYDKCPVITYCSGRRCAGEGNL